MTDKPVVYIINNSEDGIKCQIVRRENFHKWVAERTEGIKLECRPRFIKTFPDETNDDNEYLVFEGHVIVPKPAVFIESFTLEGAEYA